MREIARSSFWQLLVVYAALVVLISLNLFWKYTLHFEIFAVVIAVIGAYALRELDDNGKKDKVKAARWHYLLLVIGIVLIIGLRVVPYLDNSIPLGYDAGIYKYGIESFAEKGFNVDSWVKGAFTPGFLYLMFVLCKVFGSGAILTWLFIGFNLLLGVSVYLVGKEYFNKRVGVIAFLLYAVSVIQFKVFTYMYYKNIIALSFMLFALYFLKRGNKGARPTRDHARNDIGNYSRVVRSPTHNRVQDNIRKSRVEQGLLGLGYNRFWFIFFGILTGIMHRPTFFLFGLAFVCFTVQDYKRLGRNLVSGVVILGLTLLIYAGSWRESIAPLFFPLVESFVDPGTAPGTFVSFFTYQFSTLAYLPFAILGFFYLIWKRKFDMIFFITSIAAIIVYFQFFFFNRFIIHLDIMLILLAGSGFSLLIDNKKKLGLLVLVLMLFSAGFVTMHESVNAKSLISEEGLDLIKKIDTKVERDAFVMVLSSEYSPWVLAYSNRKTIAPGLFEENKWFQEEWERFWRSDSEIEIQEMMSVYDRPIYLFAGNKNFNGPCFSVFMELGENKLYQYGCENG
ncbi:MAG: glycosyltransferase family 39 protein [Nanoarchaeota archaeon]|nr:glycosyltransferase family 39 protein [Nanoarchaeota archaeon]MBU1051265.1 glycosyltransferase family 39 protein [Nanoarchaeota archaeon]MBU1987923.1 glycosyltransferase family 39 protein [Nanoarchaeota archaeon]